MSATVPLQQARDVEPTDIPHGAHVHHHHHGPLDPKKALTIGSLGFEPIFNSKYNEDRVASTSAGFTLLGKILPILIGLLTAGAAVVVGMVSEFIGSHRSAWVRDLIVDDNWFVAFLALFGMMTVCALLSGLPVYMGTTTNSAGSSGIPQLIGLLNGCDLRGEFSLKHMMVKWFGVSIVVGSGLAVGPEGPMIFIGAAIGALVSRIPQNPTVWKWLGNPPSTVGDDCYLRDYVSIGAGCGIAAAFRAPIAGTLFIVEEAASHFKKEQMSNIFFGGLAALEVLLVSGGAGAVLEYKVTTGAGCSSTPWWSFIFFVLCGSLNGLLGALFNHLNIMVMTWRVKSCTAGMPRKRALELVVLSLISSSMWMLSAACFTEQPATSVSIFAESDGCLKDAWKNQVLLGSQMNMRQSELCGEGVEECALQEFIPKPCLYGVQYDSRFCEKVRDAAADGNPYASTCLTAVQTPELCAEAAKRDDYGPYNCSDYCCGFDSIENLKQGKFHLPSNASCMLALGEQMPSLTGSKNTYNSMASLSLMPFKVTCQNLFARGVPHLISLNAMLVFLVCFFIASAITAGSAVPSGLLMPQMVLGALVGRCMALVAIKMQLSATPEAGDNINWLPALGAFFNAFTGSQPLTPDTDNYLDPGIAAVVGAAAFLGGSGRVTLFTTVMMVEITGDPIMIFPVNHGLYHALIDVQSSPYLPDTWQSDQLPPGIRVEDMMPRNDPIVVPAQGGRAGISAAIDGNNYSGFPLVNEDGAVIGLCDRKGLEALMARHSEVTEDDLKYVSDLYPVTVRRPFPLQMAYQLFKSMDMKNLIVVDDHHKPVAVMTRFAFLAWRVRERLGEQFDLLQSEDQTRRRRISHEGKRTSLNVSMQPQRDAGSSA